MEGVTVFAGYDKPFSHRMATLKHVAIRGFVDVVGGRQKETPGPFEASPRSFA